MHECAGRYEVRYFYGDESVSGAGYQCGPLFNESGYDNGCVLKVITRSEVAMTYVQARGVSNSFIVVPPGADGTGWEPSTLPGLETYCNGFEGDCGRV